MVVVESPNVGAGVMGLDPEVVEQYGYHVHLASPDLTLASVRGMKELLGCVLVAVIRLCGQKAAGVVSSEKVFADLLQSQRHFSGSKRSGVAFYAVDWHKLDEIAERPDVVIDIHGISSSSMRPTHHTTEAGHPFDHFQLSMLAGVPVS